MTNNPMQLKINHPALAALDEQGRRELENNAEILVYSPGQVLSQRQLIPERMLLILQGEARLLGKRDGKEVSLGKIGAGQWIGLVSMLRGSPCEEVTASEEVVALAIRDQDVAHWYQTQIGFRRWCDQNTFAAEVIALVELLMAKRVKKTQGYQDIISKAVKGCRCLTTAEVAIEDRTHESVVYIASANQSTYGIGDELNCSQPLPVSKGPFSVRLLSLPRVMVQEILQDEDDVIDEPTEGSSLTQAIRQGPSLPARSSLYFNDSETWEKRIKLYQGEGPLDGTIACFQMLAGLLKVPYRSDAIERVLRDSIGRGQNPTLMLCGQLAANLGLHVLGVKLNTDHCDRMHTPSMVTWETSFALVLESNAKEIVFATPDRGLVRLNAGEIRSIYGDEINLLLLERNNNTPEQNFGISWFVPALKKHKTVLVQVLIASFVVQLFGLANPLLIQVIIDKVISQRSLDTLQILGIALVVVALLESILGSLRTFLFAETTNRIDMRLGADVIDHLLRLPVSYFDKRPVGELGTRIAELEKIRNFLTGQALTTILDAIFSIIYIIVMALYSWILTLVALSVVPIQVAMTIFGAPLFRRQFRKAAEDNAKTQSHLVEVLSGIQTVKAQNIETISRWRWQDLYSKYVSRSFEKTITATALNETSQFFQKLSQLLVLWMGAAMVLTGDLSLGELIAFRIISGYVTQPLLRLSSIWQTIQELRISFERLADVVDTPQESNERDQAKIPLPTINGGVTFEKVSFGFNGSAGPLVLKSVDLNVAPGTFVGIVGQSGSGKSTLMKMMSRLYSPLSGRIFIDDYDIDKVELYSLRRQIGIVPQEPLLFAGTIAENISLADSEANNEDIIKAAKIADAHDFIMELSDGYSTRVGERGAGLSGGQRQRLAIARTLLTQPRLMILDEATSALDYETERKVCDNLLEALKHETVFFISHRLNTIRRADLIIVMDRGVIVEQGRHEELIEAKGRYYALYRQQERES